MDEDGTTSYTNVRFVEFTKMDASVSVYPVPAHNILQVVGITGETIFSVYDISGRFILNGTIDPNEPHIDLSSLTAGVYFLRLNNDGVLFHQKFIKD